MANNQLKSTLQMFMEQVWNTGDFTHLGDYLSPAYTVRHDPGDAWEGQTLDHETFRERVLYSRNAFPDLNFAIQEMVGEGARVAAFWIMSGTHEGDLANLPATGKLFSITGMTLYYFDKQGKICGHTQAYDRAGFMAQMGIFG